MEPDTDPSYFGGDVLKVTIESEDDSHDHYVHRTLLEKKSPYFAALAPFKEGRDNHVMLKEVDNDAFEHIVHWLYTDRFSPSFQDWQYTIIKTYAAADHLMMPRCKNMVLDNLRSKYTRIQADIGDLGLIKRLGYGASIAIAIYVTDQIVYEAITNHTWFFREEDHAFVEDGGEHVLGLMKKLMEKSRLYSLKADGKSRWTNKGHSDPARTKGCIHHEHAEGEKCYLQEAQGTTG
ncbi:Structural maintenance of chromosomes protein 1 [Exophiala xenobiotica]|uniref:Structural maintenance of chromosomes protein 1 n=1 Tax=Lithohypha guttulata TaxID=1690604 RepID=A0ABR0JVD0_9EURO|nr:Structural maintenance of chromosomes protein 1 [Lithohypha guttulata]KAK5317270.1 Structural maintenance of chromosomes protein 1 [Exophiala xenobiotica]